MFDELNDPHPPEFDGAFRRGVRARVRATRHKRVALGGAFSAIAVALAAPYIKATAQLNQIERIEVLGTDSTQAGEPTSILLVGIDTAEPLGAAPEAPPEQPRTDAILVVRVDPGSKSIRVVSIPRDLVLSPSPNANADIGSERMSVRYANEGLDGLVATIESLGFDINHVATVDYTGFKALVDLVGGIRVDAPTPLRDRSSGLSISSAGCQVLDGAQALALARARHLEAFDGTSWVPDIAGDLGRTDRQRVMLLSAFEQLGTKVPDPFTVERLASWAIEHLSVDSDLSMNRMVDLIGSARGVTAEELSSARLPTTPLVAPNGEQVLVPATNLGEFVESFNRTSPDTPRGPEQVLLNTSGEAIAISSC